MSDLSTSSALPPWHQAALLRAADALPAGHPVQTWVRAQKDTIVLADGLATCRTALDDGGPTAVQCAVCRVGARLALMGDAFEDGVQLAAYALALNDADFELQQAAGVALSAMGLHEMALAHFRRAQAQASSEDERAFSAANIGMVYARLGQNERALAHYRAATACDVSADIQVRLLANRGFPEIALGQTDAAVATLDALRALGREPGVDHMFLEGMVAEAQGAYDAALTWFARTRDAALETDTERRASAICGHVRVLGAQGRTSEALAALEAGQQVVDTLSYQAIELAETRSALLERAGDLAGALEAARAATAMMAPLRAMDAERLRRVDDAMRTAAAGARSMQLRQRAKEEAERQSLQAVGHIAVGVAHDISNLLTIQNVVLDEVRHQLPLDLLEPLESSMGQVRGLMRQLLDMARGAAPARGALDLAAHIRSQRAVLERAAAPCPLELELAPGLTADIAPETLDQLLLNLVTNAQEATENAAPITVRLAQEAAHVTLSVRDAGSGIAPALLQRITEPFFSTKVTGSGVGLSVVQRAVEATDAELRVQSALGEGTTFSVFFPRATAQDEPGEDTTPAPRELDSARVVVILDEDAHARRTLATALQQLGCHPIQVPSHVVLGATLRALPSVTAVLAALPRGAAAAATALRTMRTYHPRAAVWITSAVAGAPPRRGVAGLLPKPIAQEALRDAVCGAPGNDV